MHEIAKRGRPPLNNDRLLQVKITNEEFDALYRIAKRENTSIAEIVRRQLRATIKAVNERVDPGDTYRTA